MSYQSLLFCPDEKTARTVTQVLTELEFAVEPCSEPFAAVKKLMGEHFDAIVVDCDNEQNATLLFKSARNSTSNQASLAVAVVEGQAGVAKAFRIGANLVLTKPINVEQAKGTLRVARGLLRKGEAAKPVTPVGTTPVPPPLLKKLDHQAPVQPVPVKTAGQTSGAGVPTQRPAAPAAPWQNTEPAHFSSSIAASSSPAAHEQDVLDIDGEDPIATPSLSTAPAAQSDIKPWVKNVPAAPSFGAVTPQISPSPVSAEAKAPHAQDLKAHFSTKATSGAASATAPARSASDSAAAKPQGFLESSGKSGVAESAGALTAAALPSLTFGGAAAAEPSSGGGWKAMVGVAAAVVVAAGLYVGWTHFHARATDASGSTTTSRPEGAPHVSATQPAEPSTALPSKATTSASNSQTSVPSKATAKSAPASTAALDSDFFKNPEPKTKSTPKVSESLVAAKPGPAVNTEAEPIVVKKAGSPVSQTKVADTPAPSVMVAATNGGGPLPNFIGDPGASAKPVLQTLNISQGVSQGLLIKKVQPNYPATALRMHVEGPVQLLATIGKSGNITAVKTLSGDATLARAALEAVKQWKYKPYYLNGEPVEIQTQITVNFKLPR